MTGESAQDTNVKPNKDEGESAPSIRTIYKRFQSIRSDYMSTIDSVRSGLLVEDSTTENNN